MRHGAATVGPSIVTTRSRKRIFNECRANTTALVSNRRFTIAGHRQPLGELTRHALMAWLEYRRATWPDTANRHVLISRISALGTGPVTPDYPGKHQLRGISLEHIRRDRILQEALAARADPLHLALIFNIDHTNAMAYASAARNLLSGPAGQALLPFARNEHEGAARGEHIEIEKAYRPLTTGSWGR